MSARILHNALMGIPFIAPNEPLPPPHAALREPNGLLAYGFDLSLPRLLEAYRHGIFPWFNAGEPVLWWSPDPRMVLHPAAFKRSRSLQKRLRRRDYSLRVDTAFAAVMDACAAPRARQAGTWILPVMREAYTALFDAGYAHSVEVWMDDALVGGVYGVCIGRAFFGESMFSRVPDASKIALTHLCVQLADWDFGPIDCQMETPHLASLGAVPVARSEFLAGLAQHVTAPPAPWGELFG
jgi:leucyl/phenylalanyl-tRNA--protein transferase